ncbi:MAG: flagellar filament capping protein FliD, partial [Phycisphaerales bacterium]
IAASSGPKTLAQGRKQELQFQQAAYLDINTRLSALRDAAKAFRENKTFQSKAASTTNSDAIKVSADNNASPGTYTFIVDRLVTTQQALSRGFANRDASPLGATAFTFEGSEARLDRDVNLSDLNNGEGVSRGKIVVTDRAGGVSTIDLSRTTTVNEVLEAINTNTGNARVTASVQDGKFVVKDASAGTGSLSITNATGYSTADSLGIAGTNAGGTINGSTVYALGSNTPLAALNDGRGVFVRNTIGDSVFNFQLNITDSGGGADLVNINVGDVYENQVQTDGSTKLVKTQGAVTTVQGVIDRINSAIGAAGVTDVVASIDSTNGRLAINDVSGTHTVNVVEGADSTAADLGLNVSPSPQSVQGKRIFAGLNATLARGLNGGSGLTGDGVLNFTLRDGTSFSTTVDTSGNLTDIFAQIQNASNSGSGAKVSIGLDSNGTGIVVRDLTTGSGSLQVSGTSGADTATSLKIAGTSTTGTIQSGNLQRGYISRATLLSSLNDGQGIGSGKFRVTDALGNSQEFNVTSNTKTVGELLNLLNGSSVKVKFGLNANGDGIEAVEDTTSNPAGSVKIKIEDTDGTVAKSLNLAGTATGTGSDNKLDGSFERRVQFAVGDTLQQSIDKINAAGVGVSASLVQDGSGTTPFRIALNSKQSGAAGRFIIDTGGFDLGLQTLEKGQDSRVFYGSADASRAIAITSSTNTLDTVVQGLKLDLKTTSATPITVSVTSDTDTITAAVKSFITTFNTAITRIDGQTNYNTDTNRGGPLLGDSTALSLRAQLYTTLQSKAKGVSGQYQTLLDVGVKIGDGGTVSLDETKFRNALTTDFNSVASLFSARVQVDDQQIDVPGTDGQVRVNNPNAGNTFSSLGLAGIFEQFANRYIDSTTGILTTVNKNLDDQIKLQTDRIGNFDDQLNRKRTTLQTQFTALESALAKLQTAQSSLGSLSG